VNEQTLIHDGAIYLFRGRSYRASVPSTIEGTVASFTPLRREQDGPSLWLEQDGRITTYAATDWGHYDDLTRVPG
jgi:hypothetical protein